MPQIKDNASLVTKLKIDHYLPSPPETDANLAAFALAMRDELGSTLVYAKTNQLYFAATRLRVTGNISVTGDLDAVNSSLTGNLAVGGYLLLTNIPTSDPAEVGKVWNNGGVLNISAG